MNGTLGKPDRIKKRDEITRVFRGGRRVSDGCLQLLALANSHGRRRMAVTVSVRHGRAVDRSRIKRLCREAYRACRDELPDGYDFILRPRVGAELSFDGLCRSLRSLARKLPAGASP